MATLIAGTDNAAIARSLRCLLPCRGRHAFGFEGWRSRGNELEWPVEVLEHCGAAPDPVTGVAVEDGADRAQRRAVDVPAHDARDSAPGRLVNHRDLKGRDEP